MRRGGTGSSPLANSTNNSSNNTTSPSHHSHLRRPRLVGSRTETSIPQHKASNTLLAASSKLLRTKKSSTSHNANHQDNIEVKAASTTNLMKLGKSELSRGFRDIAVPIEDPNEFIPNYNENDTLTLQSHRSSLRSNGKPDSNNDITDNSINRSGTHSSAYVDAESLLVDVLPSFEMYNALHRHIPQGNVDPDRHDFPPTYNEQDNEPQPNTAHIGVGTPFTDPLHALNTVRYSISSESSPFQDDLNDSDNINIDKLYSLPKLTTSPIDIDIRITKNVAKPHTPKYEEQSMLKEYTNGDIIHGYCIISNQSPHKLKYEMFYVTLEGYISLVDRKKGKRTVKRFLRMVDLSASWSYTDIDVSSGINYTPGELDHYDGSYIGLTNNRTLEPHTRYKKFFMFKLPQQLLDVTCKHEHYSHCLLPPSFGIDKFKNHFKYSGIKINNVLGCGHMGIKGSPILTNDLSNDDISINYTIDARIVGKDIKTQKLNLMREKEFNLRVIPFGFTSTYATNNNNNSDDIRIQRQVKDLQKLIEERLKALEKIFNKLENGEPITNTDVHGRDLSGTFDMNTELNSQEILQRKLDQLHINNRLDDSNNYDLSRMKNMSPKANTVEAEISYRYKGKHRRSSAALKSNNSSTNVSASVTPSSKSKSKSKQSSPHISNGFFSNFLGASSSSSSVVVTPTTTTATTEGHEDSLVNDIHPVHSGATAANLKSFLLHSDHTYDAHKNKDASKLETSPVPVAVPPSLTAPAQPPYIKSPSHSKESSGLIILTSNIPQQALPYTVPSLLRKSNKFDLKNKHDQENWFRLMEAVSDEERMPLTEIPIKLTSILSNNSAPHDPPRVASVSVQLISITGISDNSIPIKLNSKFLMNKEKCDDIQRLFKSYEDKISYYRSKFNTNIDKLNELFNEGRTIASARELQFKDFISSLMASDIESMVNFETQRVEINDIFKKQVINQEDPKLIWKPKIEGTSSEAVLNVKLDFNQNISETILPNFETCLCCRFYCLRVNVKFDNNIGSTKIDIPVNVKKFNVVDKK